MGVAAVILTKDEEKNIRMCLDHLTWADEVIIVDSGSQDTTLQIAAEMGARVLVHEVKPFLISEQRNWALDNADARSEWILFIDADEVVTEELRDEIFAATASTSENIAGYQLCFKFMFMGKWLKRTQGFPTWHDRLVRRGRSRFKGGVWESFDTTGEIKQLSEPYLHYGFNNGMDAWIDRHQRYAHWKAQEIVTGGSEIQGMNNSRRWARRLEATAARFLSLSPAFRFLYCYFGRLGFLDGRAGLVYSRMMALYQFMIYLHVLEIRHRNKSLPL